MKIRERKLISRAKLEGKKLHVLEDALIDTGAAFTVIPPEIADLLELEVNKDRPRARLVTASGIIETPVKVLDMLEIADIKIEKLPVVIHKIPDPAPIKVLLGMKSETARPLKTNRKVSMLLYTHALRAQNSSLKISRRSEENFSY